jgi:hypothetical protein
MSAKWIVPLVLLLAVGLLANHYMRSTHLVLQGISGPPTGTGAQTLHDVMSEGLDLNNFVLSKNLPPNCTAHWNQVLNDKMFVWFEAVESNGFKHPPECNGVEWPSLRRLIDILPTSCGNEKLKCRSVLLDYRAKLADGLTAEQRNYIDMPYALLLTKVYAQTLLDPSEPQKPLDEFLGMLDAVTKRKPNWLPGEKLVVLALYIREQAESDDDLKSQVSAKLDIALESARSLARNDAFLLGVDAHRQDQGEEPMAKFEAPNILEW